MGFNSGFKGLIFLTIQFLLLITVLDDDVTI